VADVFISYKREERERVQQIAELLRVEGLDVWLDARLEVGRGEGFDAEIDREVTSAACVLVCWTPRSIKSVYVKSEAKKGLEREVLVPIFLEHCILPVPFNAIDTADLQDWSGEATDRQWAAVLTKVKDTVERSKADEKQRIAHSRAVYECIEDKVFPGTLALLASRIAALHDNDAWDYHQDIEAILSWLEAIAEKEARFNINGYNLAERQDGGGAWYWWESGKAAARSERLAALSAALRRIDAAIGRSREVLDRPAP
jgi:hypothetical protein